MSMSQYLFAYGTLQPGRAPARMASVAAKLRPVGKGSVRGVLYDLGRYPGAVPDASAATKIAGIVMELPDETNFLERLDAYEGCDPKAPEQSEYVRGWVVVEMEAGGTMECWIYRYNWKVDAARVVQDGIWRAP
jgi:gamma-glutamylcyclotransferase (GGCT)/AIG2-like uncharacterized protein YtfP